MARTRSKPHGEKKRRRGKREVRKAESWSRAVHTYSYVRNEPGLVDSHVALSLSAIPTLATVPSGRSTVIVRRNQAAVDKEFAGRLKDAITTLISQGNYSRIVGIHANMDHRMHSMNGPIGTRRFLPWHRIYLIKLEAELRVVDPSLFVPYWDWTTDREIPTWLKDFLPTGIVDLKGHPIKVKRFPGTLPQAKELPTVADLAQVNNHSDYLSFTQALEGVHNQVHNYVGGTRGTMSNIMYSPADPIFWLHHAFIDKVFYEWQQSHSSEAPDLAGAARVMDPWSETLDDAMNTSKLGIVYQ